MSLPVCLRHVCVCVRLCVCVCCVCVCLQVSCVFVSMCAPTIDVLSRVCLTRIRGEVQSCHSSSHTQGEPTLTEHLTWSRLKTKNAKSLKNLITIKYSRPCTASTRRHPCKHVGGEGPMAFSSETCRLQIANVRIRHMACCDFWNH